MGEVRLSSISGTWQANPPPPTSSSCHPVLSPPHCKPPANPSSLGRFKWQTQRVRKPSIIVTASQHTTVFFIIALMVNPSLTCFLVLLACRRGSWSCWGLSLGGLTPSFSATIFSGGCLLLLAARGIGGRDFKMKLFGYENRFFPLPWGKKKLYS